MGFSKAAASIMQSAAPAIGDLYSGAANATAGYARGLGDVAQQPVDQQVASNNAFLQKMGTPTAGLETAAPIGDINYGLHGYIPASTLQREGAAWGSAAQLAPQNVLNQGQQIAGATLTNDLTLTELQGQLAKIAATEPQVYQSLLENYQNQAYKQAELGQGQQRINISEQSLQVRQAYEQASLGMQAAGLRLRSQKQSFDIQQAIAQGQMPDSALSGKYGYIVDAHGNPILNARGRKIPVVRSGKGGLPGLNGKTGAAYSIASQLGITPNEYFTQFRRAGAIAKDTFNGFTDKQGNKHPALNWNQALAQELSQGVARPIAIKALREQGYMPGVRGAPRISPGEGGGNPTGAGGGVAGLGPNVGPAVARIRNPVHRRAATTILSLANEYLGTPYVYGGARPGGFDCSGLAEYIYNKAGISIPRTSEEQFRSGVPVASGALEPGDLVFFAGSDGTRANPGHEGIYIGGGKFIEAPHTGASVRVSNLAGYPGYAGARRFGVS